MGHCAIFGFPNTAYGYVISEDVTGYYIGYVPQGWNGTLTPYRVPYTFSPSSRGISNVQANLIDIDFMYL